MKKDLNEIAKYENAISKKYGKEATQHPKADWDDEKEEDELEKVRFMVDHDDTLEAIAFSVDQRASKGSPFAEVEGFNINSLG